MTVQELINELEKFKDKSVEFTAAVTIDTKLILTEHIKVDPVNYNRVYLHINLNEPRII